jgi:hypothetical protein
MKTVRVSTTFPEWPLVQQTPKESGIWGEYRFFVDRPVEECDYWVVFDGLLAEQECRCSPNGTILLTAEPPNVKQYSSAFAKQFALVLSAHRGLGGRRFRLSPPCLPWHVGRHVSGSKNAGFDKPYDVLAAHPPVPKRKLISVITSDKAFTPEHRHRLDFARALEAAFRGTIDVYGRGIRDVEDKWDAIASYKYHVVLENGSFADYWTEKICDAYLAWSFPIYMGCPNLDRYFPAGSFAGLDWNDPAAAISTIDSVLKADPYETSIPLLEVARKKCLDEYNFFPYLARICDGLAPGRSRASVRLLPEARCEAESKRGASGILRRISRALTTGAK